VNGPIECEGSPRDLGRDQGRACGRALRECFARLPAGGRLRLRLGGTAAGLRRELARHFPRQAETLAGLAVAARVPAAWLAACLDAEGAADPGEPAVAVGREITGSAALVGRALDGAWIVRRCRPEGGFRSVEATRPWLAHALVGVNEAGLAAAVVDGDPLACTSRRAGALPDGPSLAFGSLRGRFAALPSAPLVQDCLQRFATLEACLEWCMGRPGERPATLLFADADGEIAGVEIGPGGRRVLRPAEGWLAAGGPPGAREEIGKALREQGRLERGDGFCVADAAARALRLGAARYEA
jgi:hypothetical protein